MRPVRLQAPGCRLLLLAACAHPAAPPAPAPAPTAELAAYLANGGAVDTPDGHFALSLARASGCAVDLRWAAAMADGGTLQYVTSLDLGGVRDVSTYAENDRWCIEVTASAHIVMHMTSPHVKPLDRTMDDSSWGVCSDHDYIDRLAGQLRRAATRCGSALR